LRIKYSLLGGHSIGHQSTEKAATASLWEKPFNGRENRSSGYGFHAAILLAADRLQTRNAGRNPFWI